MGLFSLFSKNKQEPTEQDSGYFSREEDPAAVRARSKRASHAGEGAPRTSRKTRAVDDPVLPEKKRARRRLVGAIALALAVAVGLPMILDSEPKPIASDIAIQIPSRDKVAPLPLPAGPGEARPSAPPPAETLDQKERLVDPDEVKVVAKPALAPKPDLGDGAIKTVRAGDDGELKAKATIEKNAEKTAEKAADKAEKARKKAEADAEAKAKALAKARAESELEAKKVAKAADKPSDDNAKALAILEGKTADKKPESAPKFVVQVAALASQEKVDELQEKLNAAGIRAHTHKVSTANGERIQVRVGPFSRDEADKMRARLNKVGLSGSMVRPDGK